MHEVVYMDLLYFTLLYSTLDRYFRHFFLFENYSFHIVGVGLVL